jgi:N-acetylglucosaminyl-diphospho-decaprenol L-rhamnosyltransferase
MISAVIVTHNSEACVGACIDALAQWLPETEILVIDNASTDASCAVAERHGAVVVGLRENIGFGRACNVGARRAEHEHILFLNPDVAIQSVDVGRLTRLLEVADLGLVVPTSTNGSFTSVEPSWASEALSLTLGTLLPHELPRLSTSLHGNQPRWASGAALLVRKIEFLGIGRFDSRYFLYYEDRELSWRYRKSGLPVRITPAFVADHVGGGSTDLGDRRPTALAFAMMGWLQYVHTAYGPTVAARAWKLARVMHTAVMRSVDGVARIASSTRVCRKSLQLKEVTQELNKICASSGVLEQSDDNAYWPDAVALFDDVRHAH